MLLASKTKSFCYRLLGDTRNPSWLKQVFADFYVAPRAAQRSTGRLEAGAGVSGAGVQTSVQVGGRGCARGPAVAL